MLKYPPNWTDQNPCILFVPAAEKISLEYLGSASFHWLMDVSEYNYEKSI